MGPLDDLAGRGYVMEHIYTVREQFILNNRWLFDVEQDQLIDLESHISSTTLKPVAARLLALLARSPQVLLRRRQLLHDGWNSFGFEVCENSLNQVIHALRETFEALHPGHPYIKTVPRIGYCLLADVRLAAAEDRQRQRPGNQPAIDAGHRALIGVDELTGLNSRHAFDEMADGEWRRAQRNGLPLSLLMIDVDHFQCFNDLYGRTEGDAALNSIARCIGQKIGRAGDHAARYSGKKFAVLLSATGQEGAAHVAEKIRASVQALDWHHVATSPHPVVTVSIGVACTAPRHFETLQAFVDAADVFVTYRAF